MPLPQTDIDAVAVSRISVATNRVNNVKHPVSPIPKVLIGAFSRLTLAYLFGNIGQPISPALSSAPTRKMVVKRVDRRVCRHIIIIPFNGGVVTETWAAQTETG